MGAEAVGFVVVVAAASIGRAAVGAAGVLIVAEWVALIHVDGGVGLLVVGRHGEGGLVRVDVGMAGELLVVVAGERAVGAPGLVGDEAEEDGGDPGKAVGCQYLGSRKDKACGRALRVDVRSHNAETDDGLALPACTTAVVGCVEGGLAGECGEPDDGEDDVNRQHGNRVGEVACTFPSGSHEKIYPRGDR